jgi:hypothetical protein
MSGEQKSTTEMSLIQRQLILELARLCQGDYFTDAPECAESVHRIQTLAKRVEEIIEPTTDSQGRAKPEPKCYLNGGEWFYKGAPWGFDDGRTE